MIKADLHIHSKYSFDSFTDPKSIINKAKQLNYSLLAFTEHNKLVNSYELKEYAKKRSIILIEGEEIKTKDADDIIGLFLSKSIPPNLPAIEVIEKIKDQNGIVVYAHPFKRSKLKPYIPLKIGSNVDIIEVVNGRTHFSTNLKAKKLALKLNKPIIGSSDSHFLFEFGHVYTIFHSDDDPLLLNKDDLYDIIVNKKRAIIEHQPYPFIETASQLIKLVKNRKIQSSPRILRSILISIGKEFLIN